MRMNSLWTGTEGSPGRLANLMIISWLQNCQSSKKLVVLSLPLTHSFLFLDFPLLDMDQEELS